MTEKETPINLIVNGRTHRVFVSPSALLLNVLRDQLNVMGPKYGCGIGECGACSVLIDGELSLSCLTLAVSVMGHEITTVEAVVEDPVGKIVADKFLSHAAVQCGFCTPGMLVAATSLLQSERSPSEEDIRQHLRGNLCRCTGYAALVRSVQDAAESLDREPDHEMRAEN